MQAEYPSQMVTLLKLKKAFLGCFGPVICIDVMKDKYNPC